MEDRLERREVNPVSHCIDMSRLRQLFLHNGDFRGTDFLIEDSYLQVNQVFVGEPPIIVVVNQSEYPRQCFAEIRLQLFGFLVD